MSRPPEPADSRLPRAAMPTRRRSIVITAIVVVLVAAAAIVALATRGGGSSDDSVAGTVAGAVKITSFDGIRLDAQVTEPSGRGRHPLVVMPSSYNANKTEYAAIARLLDRAGFVTVSYTSRGFFDSGGRIDLAGSATQHDARSVIDWALGHTAADPSHVGMLGISYGAGISLLTAAQDARVRAVVALSTWSDFAEAFHPNDTLSALGLNGLLTNARVETELSTLAAQLQADPIGNAAKFVSLARSRSPITYVSNLNRNKPAILLANGWQDSLFPPTMLVDFFAKLTTPKRLQFSIGDHGGPEGAFIAGRSSRTGDSAIAWLQHYLLGRNNGIDRQQPVELEDVTTKKVQGYPSWPGSQRLQTDLAAPSTSQIAITTKPSTWSATATVGQDTAAAAGQSQFVPAEQYQIPTAAVASEPADRSFVWAAGPLPQATHVVGTPRLSLSVASSAPNATLFVYLYDTAPGGAGQLMTLTPWTVTDTSTTAKPVSVNLEPIDWTLPAGHQLAVVVDTVEPRWHQAAPAGATITVSSSADHPAQLQVPIS